MAYKVIILYQLYMPSYFLGTFTEYPYYPAYSGSLGWETIRTGEKRTGQLAGTIGKTPDLFPKMV